MVLPLPADFVNSSDEQLLQHVSSTCTLLDSIPFYFHNPNCQQACLSLLSSTGLANNLSSIECQRFFDIMKNPNLRHSDQNGGKTNESKSAKKKQAKLKAKEKQHEQRETDELIDYWRSDNWPVMLQIGRETRFNSVQLEFCSLLGEALQDEDILDEIGGLPDVYMTLLGLISNSDNHPDVHEQSCDVLCQLSEQEQYYQLLSDTNIISTLANNLFLDSNHPSTIKVTPPFLYRSFI